VNKQNPTLKGTVILRVNLLQQVKLILHLIHNNISKACPTYPEELSKPNKDVTTIPGKT